jgi:outer membrane lipoprotein-sorting protein
MQKIQKIFFVSFLVMVFTIQVSNSQTSSDILKEMLVKTKQISTIELYLKSTERFGTEYKSYTGLYKVNYKPFKAYYKQDSPTEGLEILLVSGWNNNNCLINPNSIPWINVSYSPFSSMLRKDYHLTLYEAGFTYFTELLEYLYYKYEKQISQLTINHGIIDCQGKKCHKIEVIIPDYKYRNYSVKSGEDLRKIAKTNHINEYKIVELNNLKGFDDCKAGRILQIPTDYAKKMVVYIDSSAKVPLKIEVYDEKGLFEQYEFSKIRINPIFKSDEFSEKFSDYGF